jgi:uncharacterized membrane protein YccC
MFMGWAGLLLTIVGILLAAAGSWLVFRRYLSRDARYRRRLRQRHELQRASDRERQGRMLEARMREVHEQGLRWKEAPLPDEALDRSWSRAREESLTIQEEA